MVREGTSPTRRGSSRIDFRPALTSEREPKRWATRPLLGVFPAIKYGKAGHQGATHQHPCHPDILVGNSPDDKAERGGYRCDGTQAGAETAGSFGIENVYLDND